MREGLDRRVAIVGAGHAGGVFATGLRAAGWRGPIDLFGDEGVAPYQRPPLSKAWLKGQATQRDVTLLPDTAYAEQGVGLRTATPADDLDAGARTLRLRDGTDHAADVIMLATGARPRRLDIPGARLDGVRVLRTARDASRLRDACAPGSRLVVIGGGFIGLEVAAAARTQGAEVTVLESAPRPLSRTASAAIAEWLRARHEAKGTRIRAGASVAAFTGALGRVTGVVLDTGETIACDAVLVGVGAEPNDALARAAGLGCDRGIQVDARARSSVPGVYAIGDCSVRPCGGADGLVRLESVASALEQGRQAVADLCGAPAPAPEVPWFWSDQYEHKLQIAGLIPRSGARIVTRDEGDDRMTAIHLGARDRLLAVEAIGTPGDFMAGRRLIAAGARIDAERFAYGTGGLKSAATKGGGG